MDGCSACGEAILCELFGGRADNESENIIGETKKGVVK